MEQKNRNTELDILKGLGIVFMVLGHAYFPATDFIYLFHMAVFFTASGFLFKDKYSNRIGTLFQFFIRRVKALWFPYFFWNAVFILLHNAFIRLHVYTDNPLFLEQVSGTHNVLYGAIPPKVMLEFVVKGAYFGGGTQVGAAFWFLKILFLVSLTYAAVDFLIKRTEWGKAHLTVIQGVVSVVLLCAGYACSITGRDLFGFGHTFSCYILFYLGRIFKKHEKKQQKPLFRFAVIAVAFIVLLICNQLGSVSLEVNFYENPVFLLCTSIAGWFFLYEISCLFADVGYLEKIFCTIGQNSLAIVILHFLSFKIVNYIGIRLYGMPVYLMAAFPVLFYGGAWWIAYGVVGVTVPVVLNYLRKWFVRIWKNAVGHISSSSA